jgi:hypothetical protein
VRKLLQTSCGNFSGRGTISNEITDNEERKKLFNQVELMEKNRNDKSSFKEIYNT